MSKSMTARVPKQNDVPLDGHVSSPRWKYLQPEGRQATLKKVNKEETAHENSVAFGKFHQFDLTFEACVIVVS